MWTATPEEGKPALLPSDSPLHDGLVTDLVVEERGPRTTTKARLPEAQRALRSELGVPDGWPLETVRYDLADFRSDLAGYRLVVHGTLVTQGADDAAGLRMPDGTLVLRLSGGSRLRVVTGSTVTVHTCTAYVDAERWGWVKLGPIDKSELRAGCRVVGGYTLLQLSARLFYRGSPVFAERRWHPIAGSWDQIGGLERSKAAEYVIRALDSFAVMDTLDNLRSRPGRKPGAVLWPGGLDDFLDDLWTTLETLTRAAGTPYGHDPSSKRFRESMREHPGERTLRTWMQKAGIECRHVKAGRVTRCNYRQFVAK